MIRLILFVWLVVPLLVVSAVAYAAHWIRGKIGK
jgi:hypothetical protein